MFEKYNSSGHLFNFQLFYECSCYMKSSKNIQMTKKYLKDHDLQAVPFDKGIGICVMKKEEYDAKMDKIIALP